MVDKPESQKVIEGNEGAHGHESHDEQRDEAGIAPVAENGAEL